MFEYIRGKLALASPNKAVIDVHGVGYSILIGLSSFGRLPQLGQEVQFFISPVIREDAHLLFGFLTTEERDLFEKLNQVNGIGPKIAMAFLGHLSIEALQEAIQQGNSSLLSKVPGIGKKTAERVIIDLRDKVQGVKAPTKTVAPGQGVATDAIGALLNLGYPLPKAQQAIQKIMSESKDLDLGRLIAAALRVI
ncbi:MAG: Holliday junction branch migration protein RuvA [Verrucomicrobia bacterium]|nr:Holliday junction branch migration protein RuvA [Verrucomicrobiota bacterium]